jgi:aspartate carbamoyltransferase regulatory subunit
MTKKEKNTVLQVPAIEHGTVIDHIPSHVTLTVVKILSDLEDLVTIGINLSSHVLGKKGVVKIANRKLSPDELAKIAIIAPRATLSIIESFEVVKKYTVAAPEVVTGLVRCANPNCITNHERVATRFDVSKTDDGNLRLRCFYCERAYNQGELEIV